MLHGPSLVQQYLGMPKHELVNEAFIEADKYDVPWLRRDLVSHLHHTAKKEEFLENHYYSLSEAFGGSFLVDLYPTFASALAAWHRDASLIAGSTQSNEGDAAIIRKSEATRMADVMKVAAMEDPDLTKYLLGYVKF